MASESNVYDKLIDFQIFQLIQEQMNLSTKKYGLDQLSEKVRFITYALINLDKSKKEFYEKIDFDVSLDQLDPLIALNIRVWGINDLIPAIMLAEQKELELKSNKQT